MDYPGSPGVRLRGLEEDRHGRVVETGQKRELDNMLDPAVDFRPEVQDETRRIGNIPRKRVRWGGFLNGTTDRS